MHHRATWTSGHRGRHRLICAVLATAALASSTGCGARWTDGQEAALVARDAGSGVGGRAVDTTAAVTEIGGPGPADATQAQAVAAGGVQASGDAAAVVGERPAAAGALACSARSDAPGVTDDTITVGNIATISGPVPGFGASAVGATRAYVAYRNATGGVCGRQIVLKEADDGADNSRYRALINDLAGQVLGLAGGFGAGDAGGADVVESQQLPTVGMAFSTEFQQASTVFDINPPPADPRGIVAKYRYLYDQGVRSAALAYGANGAARAEVESQKGLMEAAGIRIATVQEVPLSTLSHDSTARAVANSGADYLFFLGESGSNASMAKSMRDSGYKLKFEEYITGYGPDFIDLAGDAAEGTTTWIRSLPLEEGGNAEQAAFLQWMAQIVPDEPTDSWATDAWAAGKAFFDSLEALPGPITREALVRQLQATAIFDAGGFFGPIRLGADQSTGCAIGMRVVNGAWQRFMPEWGFLC